MRGEEVDKGRDGVEAEGVVAKIDGLKVRQCEEGVYEVLQRLRDLREEAACKDVGEVCDLVVYQSLLCQHRCRRKVNIP